MSRDLRWKAVLLALSMVVAAPSSAAEGPVDAQRLLTYCEEGLKEGRNINVYRAGYCFAFVEGVLRGWEAAAHVRDAPVNYCVGPAATLEQIVRTVTEYLRNNPAALHGRAEVSVIAAVQKAFPCSAPPKP